MKHRVSFLTILLSVAIALAVVRFMGPAPVASPKADTKESAFDRVMRTNKLRCSYVVLPPELIRDPNTGEMSGVSVDIINEVASRLNIGLEWGEEVNFATLAEDLKAGRHDALCFTSYRWVPSARVNEYTEPLFYSATYAYVRADDTRFDNNLAAINDPAIHVATIDGEASSFIKAQDFPRAIAYSMPQNTDVSFLLQAVVDKKADITFTNPLVVMGYLESHPNVLKRVVVKEPIQIHSHSFVLAKGEHNLRSMFDIVLDEMHQDGTMDRILDKYESIPNSFVRVKRVLQ